MSDSCPPDGAGHRTLRRLDADVESLEALSTDAATIEHQRTVFGALANETRLRIVAALRHGELCACELEAILDAPQSTVASHLRELREAGIVTARKDGKWRYYRIADTAVFQIVDLALAHQEARS